MSTLPRHKSFGYQVNHLARLFARRLDQNIQPLGVASGQMPALLALLEQDGLTQKELRHRVQVEQPTLANTLNRMERDGLITRQNDPEDGRAIRISLTNKAREIADPLIQSARMVNEAATAGLSPEEQEKMLDLLARMIGNLQNEES